MTSNVKNEGRKFLSIGISQYDNLPELSNCEADAHGIHDVFKQLKYGTPNFDHLVIGRVDWDNLRSSIFEYFLHYIGPKDMAVFYFSGHAILDPNGKHFLASSEIDPNEPIIKGISLDELLYAISNTKSRKILLVLDCCYSGEIIIQLEHLQEHYKILKKGDPSKSVCVIASSQRYTMSYAYKNRKYSLLTEHLIDGLSGLQDSVESNGSVTPDSLYSYAYRKIMDLPEDERSEQRPMYLPDLTMSKILATYPNLSTRGIGEAIEIIDDMIQSGRGHELVTIVKYIVNKGQKYLADQDFVKAKVDYSGVTNGSPIAEHYHQEGLSKMRVNDHEGAIGLFDEAITVDDRFASAWNYKAISLAILHQYEKSIVSFNKALEINPDDYGIWYNKGLSLFKQGDYYSAIICYDRSLTLNPVFIDALTNKGVSYSALKKFDEAIKCYELVLEIDNNDLIALNNLAMSYSKLADYDRALKFIDRAIGIDHNNSRILTSKGMVLEDMGPNYYQEAMQQYNKAINLDASLVDPLYRKGIIFGRLGDHPQAEKCFSQAIELDSRDYTLWFNKGISCHRQHHYDDAIACLNNTLELRPEYTIGWHAKGLVFHEMSKFEEAIECYDKGIELDPDFGDIWYDKGLALQELDKDKEAVECYDIVIKLNPNDTFAWLNRGNAFSSLKHIPGAIRSYDIAIEKDPLNARAWANKGHIKLQIGDYDEAIKCYEKAIEIDPLLIRPGVNIDLTHAWSNKGASIAQKGLIEEAIKCYEKAIEIDPTNLHAWYMKGLAFFQKKRYFESIPYLELALKLDQNNIIKDVKLMLTKALNNHGTVLLDKNRYLEAMNYFNRALDLDQTYYPAWYNKSLLLVALGNREDSNDCLILARKYDPAYSP